MSRRREAWAWALALAWVALEPHASARLAPPAPDFLVVVACVGFGRGHRRGHSQTSLAPWVLGLVRDALAGGPRGLHAIGYALAAWVWGRAGRKAERSFAETWLALLPAIFLALLPSALAAWMSGTPASVVAGAVWAQAAQTTLWAPVFLLVGVSAAGRPRARRTRGSTRRAAAIGAVAA